MNWLTRIIAFLLLTACQGSQVSTRVKGPKDDAASTNTKGNETSTTTTTFSSTSTSSLVETVATPTFSPEANTYVSPQSVSISSATVGATLYYTLDGSTPTTASVLYTGTVTVSTSQTLKVLAVKIGAKDSPVATAEYIITGTVAAPTITPAAGTYSTAQSVTLSTITSGATIYYTTDGSIPTTASTLYSSAVAVSASQTLKALAVKATWADSVVASAAYVIDTTPPTISYTSVSPASPHWSVSPTITLSMSEGASVVLYSNVGCTTSISSTANLSAGAGQTISPTGLTTLTTTPIYAKAVDAAGNESSCTSLLSYTTLIKFDDPDPSAGNGFGVTIVPLPNGNVVMTAPYADMAGVTDSGAVYLFNGTTGALISTLYGENNNDRIGIGGISVLTNGNFVVNSYYWNNAAGAATWSSATSGVNGPVNGTNSLIGSTDNDYVGSVVVLTNGNYVVYSGGWDCTVAAGCAATIADVGAATLCSGTTGKVGALTTSNSLVSETAYDGISLSVTALSNGNYVVSRSYWTCTTTSGCASSVSFGGAVTWGSGTTGISGFVSATNSLIGSTSFDRVGSTSVMPLTNGNYVVVSTMWDCTVATGCSGLIGDVGAVTWGNGTTGTVGPVTRTNSLVGRTTMDNVGSTGVTALSNGNYIVGSQFWTCTAAAGCTGTINWVGAVTWGSGTAGVSGYLSTANSLVGRTSADLVGYSVALSNGNYVVYSTGWDCSVAAGCSGAITDVGAVTWASGTTGLSGQITTSNSFVGATDSDRVGKTIKALTNGNYVIGSPDWDCKVSAGCAGTVTDVGAVTWASGTATKTGTISTSNSLVGSTASDLLGARDTGASTTGIVALSNGSFVVSSPYWDCSIAAGCASAIADVGAVAWGSGTAALTGVVTTSNSLVGSSASDLLGTFPTLALTNGNYVVLSPNWDCTTAICGAGVSNVGAATWGSGTSGLTGTISAANSLLGRSTNDIIGQSGLALANGNYLIHGTNTISFDCSIAAGCASALVDANSVTWGSGTTGVSGFISTGNSILGSTASTAFAVQRIGNDYLLSGTTWNAGAGLIIRVNGSAVTAGQPIL